MRSALMTMTTGLILATATQAQAYSVKTRGDQLVRWQVPRFALHVSNVASGLLHGVDLVAATRIGLSGWQALDEVPEVDVVENIGSHWGYEPGGVNENTVQVAPDWPFDEEMLAVTVSTIDSATGEILDADVLVNAKSYLFTDVSTGAVKGHAFDLASVMAHELGHVFGLDESYDTEEATMWPYIDPAETRARTLDADDVAGIEAVYAAAPEPTFDTQPIEQPAQPGSAQASAVGGCSASGASGADAGLWLLVLMAGLLWRARTLGGVALLTVLVTTGCADGTTDPATQAPAAGAESEHGHGAYGHGHPDVGGADWFKGRVRGRTTHREGGLLKTRVTLNSQDGQELTAEVWGGELDGITQHVFGYVVPEQGEMVLAEVRQGAFKAWRMSDDSPIAGRVVRYRETREREEQ